MVARNKRAENTGKKERREAEYGEAVGLLCPHSLPFSISYKKKKFQNTPASSSPTSPSFGHPPYRTSFFFAYHGGASCYARPKKGGAGAHTRTRSRRRNEGNEERKGKKKKTYIGEGRSRAVEEEGRKKKKKTYVHRRQQVA